MTRRLLILVALVPLMAPAPARAQLPEPYQGKQVSPTWLIRTALAESVARQRVGEFRRCNAARELAGARHRRPPRCHFAEIDARLPDYPPA